METIVEIMAIVGLLLFAIQGIVWLFITWDPSSSFMILAGVLLVTSIFIYSYDKWQEKQQPADDLPKPPNYDKESLLDLMEKGECAGGTIQEGKFSVFVCKN